MKIIQNWKKWIYWFSLGVAILFIYKTVQSFESISMSIGRFLGVVRPIFLAVLLSYLFYIPCRSIERLYRKIKIPNKLARFLSVITVYLIAILLIVLLLNIILPAISNSVIELANNLPAYYNNAISFVNDIPEDSIIKKENIEGFIDVLEQTDITQFVSMENITDYINGAIGIVTTIFGIFVTVVMSIYILLERTKILMFMKKLNQALFKEKTSKAIGKYFAEGNEIFCKYISSQVIDAIIVGIFSAIILWIIGLKYGALLAVMIAILNVIPILGAIISTIIVAIAVLLLTGDPSSAIWTLIIFTLVHQIDARVLKPKLFKDILKLNPVIILITITIAGAYYGILGMILSVPIMAVIRIIVNDFIESRTADKEKTKTKKEAV